MGGYWSEASTCENHHMHRVLFDEKSSFEQLIHTIINDLSLDLMLYLRMYIKMNSSSKSNPIIELKNDKDVLW